MSVYAERQHLPYPAPRLFDMVADVERYPEFLPWVVEARILRRDNQRVLVDMTVRAGPLRQRFSSTGTLDRPHRIDISSNDPLFEQFDQRWTFVSATGGGAEVEYRAEFKFRSRVLQVLMGAALSDRAAATISAFKRRAHQLYGGPS